MVNSDLKGIDVMACPTSFPVLRHAKVTLGLSYRLGSRFGATPL